MKEFILTLSCPDKIGIVAAVTCFIAEHHGNILRSHQHGEVSTRTFFMRVAIDAQSINTDEEAFKKAFKKIATTFKMEWSIENSERKKRVVILASQQTHCLADLLHRWHSKELACEIACIISNHQEAASLVAWHNIPFHHVEFIEGENKKAFDMIDQLIQQYEADVIVLARFMRIMPPQLCERYFGKMINIHHSFLPAFVGANPYQQAFNRGVKIIGATCHYVTKVLDEGPIIEQGIAHINHSYTPEDIKRVGRDVEKVVLANGLRRHLNNQVIIHHNKTIVLE
jgi:formyltetrahydrofolate deformylase